MLVSDFHFDLPEELIAQHPPEQRGSSRMLVMERALSTAGGERPRLTDAMFSSLPQRLRAGDLLILNDSRVLPARLFAVRAGLTTQAGSPVPSGAIEVLLIERDEEAEARGENVWRVLVRPARKVRIGETLLFFGASGGEGAEPALRAEVVAAGEFGERTLRFAQVDDFYARVAAIGHMPLPPYIRREQAGEADSAEDRERYQTVYSAAVGSAAAPTAGLHFTPEVLADLAARGVEVEYLTLHVGLGTFQPVRVERVEDIRLHAERYTLPAATAHALNRARREGRRVVAVGTTTTRTLEHITTRYDDGEAAGAHAPGGFEAGDVEPHSGSTSIFLAPGHRFRIVGGLLTNFHLPSSTLLMLVSAFAANGGDPQRGRSDVLAAYAHAIQERYRFYSYGDCMLLL
ncbi:MAG TPA: tRNA preQ1(34) S-adenosylmethionine ribosyltransferase-isomerase QueA [Acidobacteriaceae bacterium]|nr:tRNA preQ1(34) S-adenosylmethionine ribosyltransferase-isomerase QueA [Acidobacteriaceae bacterium]